MSAIHTTELAPANQRMACQVVLAQKAMAELAALDIVIDRLEIGDARPVLHVTMPMRAPCLPGTTMIRRRHAFGIQTEQRAEVHGCTVLWQVAS